ncbi:MAG: DUF2029 domain-containing protein [Anaerolineae bacterium]|nr:DUF2029 domain-containing protein [Anaerolineae bacterium]
MRADRRVQIVIVALILGALLVGNVIATHNVLTEPHPGHNDFMSRWEGVRSYWRDGLSPYGDEASLNIQERIYGRAAQGDEDPGFFAYPFYVVLLLFPLAAMSYAWASAIWMVLLEVCLIGALILLLDLFRWRVKPWLLAILLLWTLTYYYAARGLLLGQPGLLVYFLEVLTLWALAKDRDRLAGAALAVSTLKPQMGFLIVPFLLIWAWRGKRWPFIGTFAAVWGGLMLASFVAQPSWLGDWIDQLRRYPSYTDFGAPVWIVMQHILGLGTIGEWVINLALYALMLWGWYAVLIRGRAERFDWVVILTLTITHLSALRTATPHYVIFTVPLVFYFRELSRLVRAANLWITVIVVVLLIVPWVHFVLTVEGDFEHPTVYLLLPFGMLLLLWITRRWWWDSPPVINQSVPDRTG